MKHAEIDDCEILKNRKLSHHYQFCCTIYDKKRSKQGQWKRVMSFIPTIQAIMSCFTAIRKIENKINESSMKMQKCT